MNKSNDEQEKEPSLRQIIASVFSAAIGIQTSKNQQRDFKHGKARVFIISGIIFTLIFIGTVFTVVRLVLKQAGY